ncbi:hypothetical protein PENTCL1PPCAC_5109 [Pristionchus entomophagus]|uniref:Serpentine receptor class gamma n=1 Tax=Pristionchus entomophagus TaxID=358040 RepID=A0AAV5SNP1_9BILA|nr:hypothetical protein PENTCL1PPCAC_5109 [Pristionchus entomophagus]
METSGNVAFYAALGLGTPIILLSYRCVFILSRKEYRKHSFCRIFIVSLISNSLAFVLLMHNLRFPGIGFFPGYYDAIRDAWWQPLHSFVTRLFYVLSLMLSFVLSLNRVTSLYLEERISEKIWRLFFYLHLPLLITFSGVLNIDVLLNRAEYVQARDTSGGVFYMFVNYNLMMNIDSYWMIIECALDLICNILIILKFVHLRMGQMKRTPFENSLYLISFSNFIVHTATTAMQILLRYNLFPPASLSVAYLISNAIFDAALLFPTVAILALTKEIRTEVKG